ncbi:MAG TPA: polysaccharide deacetylase family protein [Solirubrobacteraceae bacterium]|nr:polysaccharide deacetylase family protein [Solirubrobacteraceae bacterium]
MSERRSLGSLAAAAIFLAALGPAAGALANGERGGRTATSGPTTGGGAKPPPHPKDTATQPPLRYRPVGCVASGPAVDYRHGPRRRWVALTFDDGPSPYTRRFVQMLRAQKAVATFFTIGRQVESGYKGVLREELRDGDALGDHTWTHPNLPGLSAGAVRSQLALTRSRIGAVSGYLPCVFRPPYGTYDSTVLAVARSLGLDTVTWEVDPSDYALPGSAAIVQRVLAQVQPGSVVLSHDGGGPRLQTLAAYPPIIAALRARGYRFVTVPQLLGLRGIYRECRRDCEEAAIEGRPPPGSIVRPG